MCIFVPTKENDMIDDQKVFLYDVEMAEHANGVARFFESFLGGRLVTKGQIRETTYLLLQRGILRVVLMLPKKKRLQRYP